MSDGPTEYRILYYKYKRLLHDTCSARQCIMARQSCNAMVFGREGCSGGETAAAPRLKRTMTMTMEMRMEMEMNVRGAGWIYGIHST
jgi:hypothetical protein